MLQNWAGLPLGSLPPLFRGDEESTLTRKLVPGINVALSGTLLSILLDLRKNRRGLDLLSKTREDP